MLGVAGDAQFTSRTSGSKLFVNPLMAMYFAVTVEGLVRRHLYLGRIEDTQTIRQVATIIEDYRYELEERRIPRMFPH